MSRSCCKAFASQNFLEEHWEPLASSSLQVWTREAQADWSYLDASPAVTVRPLITPGFPRTPGILSCQENTPLHALEDLWT